MSKGKIISLFIIAFLLSCGKKEEKPIPDIIVSMGNECIYRKDIVKLLPNNVTKKDSALIVNNYIDEWLSERLIYYEALKHLEDTSVLAEKIQKYRRQLYAHYYIDQMLNINIDYQITENEINEYYKNNLQDYVSATTYVKAHYIVIEANVYTYYDILEKVRRSSLDDEEELKNYCIGTARNAHFVKEWMEIGDFLNSIHYPNILLDYELPYVSILDFLHEEQKRYLVKIDEYVLKGESTPLDLVKNDIIQIIINNRKRDKYIQLKNNLINDAVKSGVVTLKQ